MSAASARVVFTTGFARRYTGGVTEFTVEAKNLRGVLRERAHRGHDGLDRTVRLDHQRVGIGRHQGVQREEMAGVFQHPPLVGVVESDQLEVPAVPLI